MELREGSWSSKFSRKILQAGECPGGSQPISPGKHLDRGIWTAYDGGYRQTLRRLGQPTQHLHVQRGDQDPAATDRRVSQEEREKARVDKENRPARRRNQRTRAICEVRKEAFLHPREDSV